VGRELASRLLISKSMSRSRFDFLDDALSLRLHEQSLSLKQVDLRVHGFMMSYDVLCSFDFNLLELLMISNNSSWCCP